MSIRFDIQVQSGTVTITLDSGEAKPANTSDAGGGIANTSEQGGNSPGNPSGHPGGAGPGYGNASGCCRPLVIGPIVVDGAGVRSGMNGPSGTGGGSPGNPSPHTGGGGPGGQRGGNSPGNPSPHTGGGGPRTAGESGCCSPVVIGPIVITDCSSGQGAASSNADPGSKAVCVSPPAETERDAAAGRTFTVQVQQASNWCWAAVAVSVNDFLDPQSAVLANNPIWTQASLANNLLGIVPPGCSQNPGSTVCNQPAALDVALTITRNLMQNGALFSQHFTFNCIQSWVTAQLPLGARIKWWGEGAHFIALDGCKVTSSGQQLVHVQDPAFNPTSSPGFWDYDALVEDYLEAGYWDSTYLVTA